FNSVMFFVVSCVAGLVYMAAGGQLASLDLTHIVLFGLLYQITSVVTNQVIFNIYDRIEGVHSKFFSIDAIWDFALTLVIFPYAIALYLTEAYIGTPALILLGIPFLIMSL